MENVVFTQLSIPEIRQLFRQELESYFARNPFQPLQTSPHRNIVDLTGLLEARPILGSRSTLYKKVSKGLIPHSKQGKKLYFNLDEIDHWLLANNVKTIGEREREAIAHAASNR